MKDKAARDIFARTWGFHIMAVNPKPRRTVPQGEGNPLSVDLLGVEMTFLRLSQIINRCQRHRCNTTGRGPKARVQAEPYRAQPVTYLTHCDLDS
ncbi:hypothetical protein E5D57_012827 [Metarhizium anisopliae]|nr:hypothetical protein E5D57_012827 [Metarhizium anisopliae]